MTIAEQLNKAQALTRRWAMGEDVDFPVYEIEEEPIELHQIKRDGYVNCAYCGAFIRTGNNLVATLKYCDKC